MLAQLVASFENKSGIRDLLIFNVVFPRTGCYFEKKKFFEKGLALLIFNVGKKSTPMRIEDGRTPERTSSSNLSTIPATFRLFQQPFDYPGNFSIIQQLFDFRQRTSIVVEAQYPKLKVSLFNFDEKSPKSTKPTYAFFFSHEVVAKTGSYCAPITTV